MEPFLLSPNKRDAHEPFVLSVAVSCPRCKLEIAGVVEKPKDGADVAATIRGCVDRLQDHYCDPDGVRRGRPHKKPLETFDAEGRSTRFLCVHCGKGFRREDGVTSRDKGPLHVACAEAVDADTPPAAGETN